MYQPIPYIQRLSELVVTVVHVSDMLEGLLKEQGSAIDSVSFYIEDTLESQQKLVQELLALQQEQDLALATKLGEV